VVLLAGYDLMEIVETFSGTARFTETRTAQFTQGNKERVEDDFSSGRAGVGTRGT
jgi:hypothetical protein